MFLIDPFLVNSPKVIYFFLPDWAAWMAAETQCHASHFNPFVEPIV